MALLVGPAVMDASAQTVSIAPASASVVEGSPVAFKVTLSEEITSNVIVTIFSEVDDTEGAQQATAGTDFQSIGATRTIVAGETESTAFSVTTSADDAIEGPETFKVTIRERTGSEALPPGVEIGTESAVVTIEDEDTIKVSVEAASATEGSALSFTVRLSKAASSDVVLGWSTGDDDTTGANQATSGTDYTAVTSGSVTIAASQTTATLTVQTTEDTTTEGDETFKVTITGTTLPADVAILTSTAVGTIRDDDKTVSVAAASATEGSPLSFTVRLSKAASSDVVLGWSTGDDDTAGANQATADTDYTGVARGSVTIAASQTTATFTVQTTADTIAEHDETFKVTIIGTTLPAGVVIGTATAVGTIENDDGAWAWIEDASRTEGSPVLMTIRLSEAAPTGGVSVGFSTGDDDTAGANQATAGTDYRSANSRITVKEGQTSVTFAVGTFQDSVAEGNETFKFTLSNTVPSTGWSIGSSSTAVGTILDDDNQVSVEAASATEGSALSFTVRLPHAVSSDVVLGWSTGADDTSGANQATAGTDYTAVTSGSVTIAASQTTATLTVQTAIDTATEGNETFKVTITGTTLPSGVAIGTATAVGTITDASAAVSVVAASATEGSPLSFTVRLSKALSSDVVLGWSTGADDTSGANQATSGTDYTAVTSGSVTIAASQTTATLTVQTTADTIAEPNETLKVSVTGTTLPPGVSIGTVTALGTIVDDDGAGVSVESGWATEGSPVVFTIRLTEAAPVGGVSVSFSTSTDDTSGANQATSGTDYRSANSSILVKEGQTSVNFAVETFDDSDAEGNETFKFTIRNPVPSAGWSINTATVVGTIVDDDDNPVPVSVSVEAASATEGSPLSFTVRLSQAVSSAVVLGWSTGADDTPEASQATADTDYTAVTTGSVTIAASQTTATLTVQTTADNTLEAWETLKVTITGTTLPSGVTIGTATAVGTIRDDDGAGVSIKGGYRREGSPLVFTVRLSEAATADVVLGWSTGADDTAGANQATAGTDYTAVTTGSVTIAASQTTAWFSVQTTADTAPESDETFKVTITGTTLPTGVAIVTATAVGTIVDDDTVRVSIEAASATEGSALSFGVRLSREVSSNVVLGWSTGADDTAGANQATADTDYTAVTTGSVTIAASQTTAWFTVQTTADTTPEPDETLKVTITGTALPAGVVIGTATAVGTIVDDDTVQVSVEAASATEGSALSFTVRLSNEVSSNVVLGWATGPDKTSAHRATAGTDFTLVRNARATIAAGQTTATLTVKTTADTTVETDETLKITIIGTTLPAGVAIGTATAVGTIVDDDGIKVTVEPDSVMEGEAGNWFKARLSEAATADVVLFWSTGPDDTPGAYQATEGTDYKRTRSRRSIIRKGKTWVNLVVDTYADNLVEDDETYKVTIVRSTLPAGVAIKTASAVGTIVDHTLRVKLWQPLASAVEKTGYLNLGVDLSRENWTSDVVVSLTTHDDDTPGANQATAGTDYTAVMNGQVTIRRGKTQGHYRVTVADDSMPEETESFKVSMTRVTLPDDAALVNTTAVYKIADDDSAEVFVQPASAHEGSPVEFTAKLTTEVDFDVSVWMSTATNEWPGSRPATPNTDFTSTRAVATIPAGETKSDVFSVPTAADNDVEGDETFIVNVAERSGEHALPPGMRLPRVGTVGTIIDTDATVSVGAASATEGSALSFPVRLSKAVSSSVVLGWSTGDDDTAGANQATADTDYTAVTGGSVTIAEGETTATLTVQTTDDSAFESDETFQVTITGTTLPARVFIGTATAVGTIEDNDAAAVSVEAASATEGSALSFPVTLSRAVSSDVVLGWSTGDTSGGRPATADTDYTAVTDGSVTFAEGETTATLTVQTTDDAEAEGDETFQVTITGTTLPADAFIRTDTAVGTILDDDGSLPPPPPPPAPPPAGSAPSQLTATAVSYARIDLAWRDNSANETGFRVQRRTGDSADWEEVAITESDATTFSDLGLQPETRYRYRVQVFNDTGSSAFSNEAEATTPPAPEPTVTRFTPLRGPVGTAVRVTGTDFLGDIEVRFNGVSALEVEVRSTTSLEVIVPPEATSGPISVETVGGTAVSAEVFTVTAGIRSRLFVPIVLSSRGRTPGSLFTSEMTLTNRGTTRADIAYTYRAAFGGGSGTAVDALEPGRQQVIPDAIAYLAGLGVPIGKRPAGGTLAVDFSNLSSPEAAAVTVRVTTPVEVGRAGLAYPGLNRDDLLTGSAFITGLRHNRQDRSNVAVQNAGNDSEGDITLRVTVYSGDAAASGTSEVLPDLTLPAGGFRQYNGILKEAGMENGYVKVERVEGRAPYYAYGVINDNSNSDGSFVFPVREDSLVGTRGQTLPVLLETRDFSSELTVTNFSRVAKRVDFGFVAEAVESEDGTARFSLELEAGEQRILPGVVDWMRRQGVEGIGRANRAYVGALFAEVAEGDMSGIVMAARTGAPDQRGGQYSLFYSGVPYGSASVESAWIHGLQQNGENRSNLALINTGEIDDSDSLFEIDIYDGDEEAGPRTRSVLLGPRRWYQLNGILAAAGQGYVQVRKVSGSNPFVAYGVINDGGRPGQRSGDGAFLPSRP